MSYDTRLYLQKYLVQQFDPLLANSFQLVAGSNITLTPSGTSLTIASTASGSGGGTVTSVDSTTPTSLFTVSGNPITLSGTLAYALTNAASSKVWAGPVSGADATPTYRSLVAGDIPTLPFTKISGTVPVGQGGTNLTATPANGQLPIGNGTDYTLATITPGTGVQVSNGSGTITVSATGALGGTVTSVAQSVPASLLSISGTPITTAGTLAIGLTSAASGQFWAGPTSGAATTPAYRALVAADIPSGIDATKIADGSVTSTEFQYINTLSSNAQTQLNNKQGLDATLTALAAYNTDGLLTQTAADTFVGRTLTGTANEVTVTNGNGVAGNPTFSLASGIDATKIADGSVTSTEFQYINTLTSNAQTQIDGKAANTEAFVTLGTTSGLTNERSLAVAGGLTIQDLGAGNAVTISGSALQPLDATLTALAAYNTTGFITQTAPDTFSGRTLAVAGGLTIQEAGSVITISASGVSGSSGSIYGDGADGAKTISTNTTEAVPKIFRCTTLTINTGCTWTVKSGTLILCTGAVDIQGTGQLVVAADIAGGVGATAASSPSLPFGQGPSPGGGNVNYSRESSCGGGGCGGNGGNGGIDTSFNGGSAGGRAILPMVGATGSGGGAGNSGNDSGVSGNGGAGGGLAGLYSGSTITIAASAKITANGGAGSAQSGTYGQAGGGGSGGIWDIGALTSITNSGTIEAKGGAGGNAVNSGYYAGGGGGGIVCLTSASITAGTITLTGGAKGSGGAGFATTDATAGSTGVTYSTTAVPVKYRCF